MVVARKRKLQWLLLLALVLSLVCGLVLYALRQNINLFYTPSQVQQGKAPLHHPVRVGGMVMKGSLVRKQDSLTVRFDITDRNKTLTVTYTGILPDLFREGQGVVAEGEVLDNHTFKAIRVLAKHDEKYMPPEVAATLVKKDAA